MNLYLRLIKLLWCLPFVRRGGLFDESRLSFRVWPNDCDFNLRMNNGRYLTFMDLGRIHLLRRNRVLWRVVRARWTPAMSTAEINFIRPLRLFRRFELITRVLAWDEKYVYLEQRFEIDGESCATATVCGLFLRDGYAVAMDQAARTLGIDAPPPPLPTLVRHWKERAIIRKEQTARDA